MATITAQSRLSEATAKAGKHDTREIDDTDQGLERFFYAAGLALILSAIQGVVQRLPGISDWLTGADYGGYMITNLAQTHITIVGAGTIMLTGLIYYVLPRITHRPIFSKALTNISFWGTIVGVFGFYLAMLSIGAYEGAMVHAGWPYEAARNWLGAWHKAPMAVTAAIMGVGYWTFVTNVYVTVRRAARQRKMEPGKGPSDNEFLLAKFFVAAATGLLFGTVQGVYQVMPWSLDWLRATGKAGQLIDPMAHAHINLVGGVSIGVMGLMYYFLPKMLGRPIFSLKLGNFSFWCIVIGVFGFYLSALSLGFLEGSMVLTGLTPDQARDAMGIWHPLLLAGFGSIMGLGFWTFVTNILLTIRRKASSQAPADRTLAFFIGFSAVAILVGTIQGVIQVTNPVEEWLEAALPSSYFVTPLAHAQLNMVGFGITALATMTIFLLPRIVGRPIVDPVGGRRVLTVIAVGIVCTYLVFFTVGLLESIQIHNGATPSQAIERVAGVWGRYALFAGAQAIVGLGYIMWFRYIAGVIGREARRAYFRMFFGRMRAAVDTALRIHPKALPATLEAAQRRAIVAGLFDALGGGLGFMGMGWIYSGRPFIGIMLLGSWGGGFWTLVYVIFAVAGGDQLLPVVLVPYFVLPILSGVACYRSYMRDARVRLAVPAS